jgi:hypothetical protein
VVQNPSQSTEVKLDLRDVEVARHSSQPKRWREVRRGQDGKTTLFTVFASWQRRINEIDLKLLPLGTSSLHDKRILFVFSDVAARDWSDKTHMTFVKTYGSRGDAVIASPGMWICRHWSS